MKFVAGALPYQNKVAIVDANADYLEFRTGTVEFDRYIDHLRRTGE